MTLPIWQCARRYEVEDLTDFIWPSQWLRLLLKGGSLLLYAALAAAQMPTVPASAAPSDDGQWTMPHRARPSERHAVLAEQLATSADLGPCGIREVAAGARSLFGVADRGAGHERQAMKWHRRFCVVAAAGSMLIGVTTADAAILRVCADPNNLPFSDQAGRGFENEIVELIAKDLGSTVDYTWWAQRRYTLKAGICDVWSGVASGAEMMTSTRPYYRSSYVFVTRADRGLHIASFDDPQLRKLIIGVQMVGSDAMNTPPAHALARRGIVQNVRGYMLYGDYRQPHPASVIIDTVGNGDVDVAVGWAPTAGYFAEQGSTPLTIEPVEPWRDGTELPMAFYISMGVRRGDHALLQRLNDALERNRAAIAEILAEYHVPVLPDAFAPR